MSLSRIFGFVTIACITTGCGPFFAPILRRERYTRADVEESARELLDLDVNQPGVHVQGKITVSIGEPTTQPTTAPATQSRVKSETPERKAARLEHEQRQAAVFAATQPA